MYRLIIAELIGELREFGSDMVENCRMAYAQEKYGDAAIAILPELDSEKRDKVVQHVNQIFIALGFRKGSDGVYRKQDAHTSDDERTISNRPRVAGYTKDELKWMSDIAAMISDKATARREMIAINGERQREFYEMLDKLTRTGT